MKISYILSMIKKKLKCHILGVHDIDLEPLSCSMIYTLLLNHRVTTVSIIDTQYGICRNCNGYFKITAMPVEQAFSYSIKFTTQQITVREFQDATTLLKL